MAGEIYSIEIRLNVDDSQLKDAIEKTKGLGIGKGGSGQRLNLPNSGGVAAGVAAGAAFNKLNTSGINGAYNRLSGDFLRNMLAVQGLQRNLSNFGSAIGQTSKAFLDVVPNLKGLISGLGAFAASFAAIRSIGGLTMFAGKKVLMGENMREAASDSLKFITARKVLGTEYEDAFRKSTEIAATYGYDRAGILQTATMLSNLRLDDINPLGMKTGLELATIAGKITHFAGADYNRIAINIQQMLGQATTSSRDIRELIQAAPIVSTIAQQKMLKKTGKVGDLYEYFKDKINLLDTLYEVDKLIEAHPVMKLRGQITLSKKDLWIQIANSGTALFEDITNGVTGFNKMLEKNISRYMSTYNQGSLNSMFTDFTNSVESLMKVAVNWIPRLINIVSWANENINTTALIAAAWKTKNPAIILAAGTVGQAIDEHNRKQSAKENANYYMGREIALNEMREYATSQYTPGLYGFQSDTAYANAFVRALPDSTVSRLSGTLQKAFQVVPDTTKVSGRFLGLDYSRMYQNNPAYFQDSTRQWFRIDPRYIKAPTGGLSEEIKAAAYNSFAGQSPLKPEFHGMNTLNTDISDSYQNLLTSMAGERRALTINFNKEIVAMNNNITATDVSNLEAQIRPMMEGVITSGLHRALAHATAF